MSTTQQKTLSSPIRQSHTYDFQLGDPAHPASNLRLYLYLRWGALLLQLLLIAILREQSTSSSALPFSTTPFAPPLLLLLVTNVLAFALQPLRRPRAVLGGLILFDTALLTWLLALTGGAANPLSILYLVHVSLATVLLGQRWTWCEVLASIVGFALLFTLPTSAMAGHHHEGADYQLHLWGMWVAYALAAIITTTILGFITRRLEDQRSEIEHLKLLAQRQEQLAALARFASSAAHELGTPLSTMTLIVDDLLTYEPSALTPDLEALRSELHRCRDSLKQMTAQAGEALGETPVTMRAGDLCQEVLPAFSEIQRKRLHISGDIDRMISVPKEALRQALKALVQNALEASPTESPVTLSFSPTLAGGTFLVRDHGSGVPGEIMARLGEPFVSSKPLGYGMGLGLYLANLICVRLKGKLTIESTPGDTQVSLSFCNV